MRLYLIALGLEGFLTFCLKETIDSELLMIVYMIINSLLLIGWFLIKSKDKTIFMILLYGFLLRLLALAYDRNVALLPFNNVDANAFHKFSVQTANALPDIMLEIYTGFYSKVLGSIYYIFGPYRVWGQFLNISLIMLASTKIIDIGNLLMMKLKNIKIMVFLWLFMPIPFLNGSALIRESSIYYFIVLSIYFFIKWFEKYNIFYCILSVLFVYIASLYHGGVLVIALPYIYTFIFYNKEKKRLNINVLNIICLILIILICFNYISKNSEEIFNKVNMDTGGGSVYLTGIKIENTFQFILFGPIKAIYLLFSPMPWLIRGGLDIVTFVLDSSIWIIGSFYIIKNYKIIDIRVKVLFIIVLIGGVVFGMGTLNTGTAIRHRNKFLSFIIISILHTKDQKILYK